MLFNKTKPSLKVQKELNLAKLNKKIIEYNEPNNKENNKRDSYLKKYKEKEYDNNKNENEDDINNNEEIEDTKNENKIIDKLNKTFIIEEDLIDNKNEKNFCYNII